MHEPEFDPRFIDWLCDDQSAPSDWVLEAVRSHVRRHPRRRSLRARLDNAMNAVVDRHRPVPAARVVLALGATVIAVALAGTYLAGSPGLVVGPSSGTSPSPAPDSTPTPTPASVVASERFADPAGDAPEGEPDIVEITSSVSVDGDLVLGVRLADAWPTDGRLLNVWFRRYSMATCDPLFANAVLYIDPPSAEFVLVVDDKVRASPGYRIDGRVLTVRVPLAALGDPDVLGIGVRAGTVGGDVFPPGLGICQDVSLVPIR